MDLKILFQRYRYDVVAFLLILVFVVLFVIYRDSFGFLSDREQFQSFISGYGIWAPLVIIAVIVFEVIVAPLPGFVPIVVSGFLFGPVLGALYAYIGNVIGSVIVFLIARHLGRKVALRIVSGERLARYENMIDRHKWLLYALYFFPIIPTDIISIVFGLSHVRFRKFFLIMAVGFVVNVFAITYFGDYLAKLYFLV